MKNILAIETSSDACSVALSYKDKIFSFHELMPQKHTEKLMGLLEKLIRDAGAKFEVLHAIAVGCGPGSFTGIRLSCAVAQGLAYSCNIDAIRVSSLEVMAKHFNKKYKAEDVMTLVNAHMKQLYIGRFRYNQNELSSFSEKAIEIGDFNTSDLNLNTFVVGDGCQIVINKLKRFSSKVYSHYPNALDLLSLAQVKYEKGETLSAESILPVYLTGEEHWNNL